MTGTRTCETGKLYEVCQRQTKQKQKGALACARTRIPRQKITSKVFFFIMLLGSGSGDGQMHLNIYIYLIKLKSKTSNDSYQLVDFNM